MGKIYFTADTHFGHDNVLKLDGRPFANVGEMDDEIVARWNGTVRQCDTVYHLGDFSLRFSPEYLSGILERLNGEIRLVCGNHDGTLRKMLRNRALPKGVADKFAFVGDYKEARSEGLRFRMSHYPMPCYNGRYHTRNGENEATFMLHGHVHATPEHHAMQALAYDQNPPMQLVNVGCMLWGYAPVSPEQVVLACSRPCGMRTGSECRKRWMRGAEGCDGCGFGSYWHGGRSFGHLANADLFKRERFGRWQGLEG